MANESNLELMANVAKALGDLRERFVFVGGCATGLLITDPAAAPVRATRDVDVIVAVVSLADYQRLSEQLRGRGFTQTVEEGEPPYRWTLSGMKLDVMPTADEVLGFSNRWYVPAMRMANLVELRRGLMIRLVAPAYFVATKLDAFLGRGGGDYLGSHDLEDVLSVIDGRPELVAEIAQAEPALRAFVSEVIGRLMADESFIDRLPGLVLDGGPQQRTSIVAQRLSALSKKT
jgi:predicted nucleotidyltransferase